MSGDGLSRIEPDASGAATCGPRCSRLLLQGPLSNKRDLPDRA